MRRQMQCMSLYRAFVGFVVEVSETKLEIREKHQALKVKDQ